MDLINHYAEIIPPTIARKKRESDRKMLKAAIKHSANAQKEDPDKVDETVRHRVVPPDALAKWSNALAELKDEIARVLVEEKEDKAVGYFPENLSMEGLSLIYVCRCVRQRCRSRRGRT